ncbi:MAG: hypothetical protein Q8R30_03100 [bacterium]|nr:hypothetical protein [bacterium]MDZ4286049.1 hypothetical protein [Candidatus Sungbacteria bacterium]
MKTYFERSILFWAVIIFFALIAALFYFTGSKRLQNDTIENQVKLSPSLSPSEQPVQYIPQNGSPVQVKEDQENPISVRYANGTFTPSEVTIKNETGCFVEIQNAGDQNIIPRLGPYDPQKEQGFLYPSIAPGNTSLIDPRYGTGAAFSFYDKNNPAASFIVHIDPTCL